jgi:signal transduction histidine kinase
MSDDGTLTLLVGRWTSITARSIEQSAALVQSRQRERNLAFTAAGAVVLLIVTGWLAVRIRRQSYRARLAEAERARLAEQLQQSQRIETVGRLAGGVAHDFNNLLTVINGYADMLQADHSLADEQRAQVIQIAEAGGQAANLTQQLLAFSRKQVVQPRVLNLNDVVGDVARMLRRLVGEHIELTTALDPMLHPVMADPGQLRQVLMNLAVNSRDAMPAGGRLRIETANVTVEATEAAAHPHAAAGPHVVLTVADTGSGIAPDVIGSIFEPFFTTKARGEGTGLGLSIVYGVVRQNGGWITVDSEPGRGTTFRVHLPRVTAGDVPGGPSQS